MMNMLKMCLNWKVVAGLAVAGLGVALLAPNALGAALPLLVLAACPLSMLVMMGAMGGMGRKRGQCAPEPGQESAPLSQHSRDEELVGLKAQHELLGRQIARLERDDALAVREAESVARTAGERAQPLA